MKLKIADKWKWAAKDDYGEVWLLTHRPVVMKETWILGAGCDMTNTRPFELPDLGPWKQSLHEILPDGSLKKHVERPDLKVDDRVLVRDTNDQGWINRHFAAWNKVGMVMVFNDGRSSWSNTCPTLAVYKMWKLPEEE